MFDMNFSAIKQCRDEIEELLLAEPSKQTAMVGQWRKYGPLPRTIIPFFLQLIESYYQINNERKSSEPGASSININNYPKFSRLVTQLAVQLTTWNLNERRFLYAYLMRVGERNVYVGSFLHDLFTATLDKIGPSIQGIAQLLVRKDPSCVVQNCDALKQLYIDEHAGPGFNMSHFINDCLPHLIKYCLPNLTEFSNEIALLTAKLEELRSQSSFSEDCIQKLKEIFAYRWNLIKGTDLEYTRLQSGLNTYWILAAQLLSGAGVFSKNYYRELMPTLVHDLEPATRASLVDYALNEYIVTGKGQWLSLIRSSVDAFNLRGLFINCSAPSVSPYYTEDEISLIQYAAKRYSVWFKRCQSEHIHRERIVPALPVKRSTVYLIYNLLLKTFLLHEIAEDKLNLAYLIFCEELTRLDCDAQVCFIEPTDIQKADVVGGKKVLIIYTNASIKIGYKNLLGQYQEVQCKPGEFDELFGTHHKYISGDIISDPKHKLCVNKVLSSIQNCSIPCLDDERKRLYSHFVTWNSKMVSVLEALTHIANGDTHGGGCTSVWGTYLLKFVIDHMPYIDTINYDESYLNIKLMRKKSERKQFSDEINLSESQIFDRNCKLFTSLINTFQLASFDKQTSSLWEPENFSTPPKELENIFAKLRISIPARGKVDLYSYLMNDIVLPLEISGKINDLSSDIRGWFNLLRTEHFFSKGVIFHDPRHIFLTIRNHSEVEPNFVYSAFCDELIKTMDHISNEGMQYVQINVRFNQLLQQIDIVSRNRILKSLHDEPRSFSIKDFNKTVYDFYMLEGISSNAWLPGFFKLPVTEKKGRVSKKIKQHSWEDATLKQVLLWIEQDRKPRGTEQVPAMVGNFGNLSSTHHRV